VQSHFRRKLRANWTGPFRIVDTINDYVFKIQDLLKPDVIIDAHIMRLRPFVGQRIVDNDLLDQIRYDRKEVTYESFAEIALIQGKYFLTVKWLGFSINENTSETFESCYAHNPDMVIAYLHSLKNSDSGYRYVSRLLKYCQDLDEL
jgi:hypothetical protein